MNRKIISIVVLGLCLVLPLSASSKTAFVYSGHEADGHNTGRHPERIERIKAVVKGLKESGLYQKLSILEVSPANVEWVEKVHAPDYIKRAKAACEAGKKRLDSRDTPISKNSYKTALKAVGACLNAVDAVMTNKAANAFCAVRPPGHHAKHDRAMGFCMFNNVAIAARYAREKYKLKKVLIIDWDVHHGNGTQDSFYSDPDILFYSIHQFPFYPGTGKAEETGSAKGKGVNINVPLKPGAGDKEYSELFKNTLYSAAIKFKPDIIFISAGFDACKDDPLGGMKLTAKGFAQLTGIVKQIADKTCRGKIVSILEGGYSLEGLSNCVNAHIAELMKE